jgi:hypothetical protein
MRCTYLRTINEKKYNCYQILLKAQKLTTYPCKCWRANSQDTAILVGGSIVLYTTNTHRYSASDPTTSTLTRLQLPLVPIFTYFTHTTSLVAESQGAYHQKPDQEKFKIWTVFIIHSGITFYILLVPTMAGRTIGSDALQSVQEVTCASDRCNLEVMN